MPAKKKSEKDPKETAFARSWLAQLQSVPAGGASPTPLRNLLRGAQVGLVAPAQDPSSSAGNSGGGPPRPRNWRRGTRGGTVPLSGMPPGFPPPRWGRRDSLLRTAPPPPQQTRRRGQERELLQRGRRRGRSWSEARRRQGKGTSAHDAPGQRMSLTRTYPGRGERAAAATGRRHLLGGGSKLCPPKVVWCQRSLAACRSLRTRPASSWQHARQSQVRRTSVLDARGHSGSPTQIRRESDASAAATTTRHAPLGGASGSRPSKTPRLERQRQGRVERQWRRTSERDRRRQSL